LKQGENPAKSTCLSIVHHEPADKIAVQELSQHDRSRLAGSVRMLHGSIVHRVVGLAVLCLVAVGCQNLAINGIADRVIPSNDRNWVPDLAKIPFGELNDGVVTLHNFRSCKYITESDFVVNFSDRVFRLSDIVEVDYVVVPFQNTPVIAHTMLSFRLANDEYVCVSSEIRKEIGETFSPMLGVTNQFELIYVIADEKDLIRLRTRYRKADVYIYPTVADETAAQQLFIDIMQRINQLASKPEFYNTFVNNCTTNIAQHVNGISSRRPIGRLNWQVLLPGMSPKYAYELGLLDQSVPFDELRQMAHINPLADQYFDDPDFSRRIRVRLSELDSNPATRQR
jgi:Domain of unknown function (DUF4105)